MTAALSTEQGDLDYILYQLHRTKYIHVMGAYFRMDKAVAAFLATLRIRSEALTEAATKKYIQTYEI